MGFVLTIYSSVRNASTQTLRTRLAWVLSPLGILTKLPCKCLSGPNSIRSLPIVVLQPAYDTATSSFPNYMPFVYSILSQFTHLPIPYLYTTV